nr:mortality factor 4-like protein 2 isoform X8 [Peromyscus maniculatus bairdii]
MERRPSTGKDRSRRRGGLRKKSHSADNSHSFKWGNSVERRPSTGERPTGQGRPQKKSCPAEEGRSFEWGKSVGRRPSTGEDRPKGRGGLRKKSHTVEESHSFEWGNSLERRPSTGEDRPTGRGGLRKKSRPAEEGRSVEWGNSVERRPSTGEDHPTERDGLRKKSRPAEEGRSVKWGNFVERRPSTGGNRPTGRGWPLKKSCRAEKHLSAERSCPPKKRCFAEKGLPTKRFRSVEQVHSGERGHLSKKSRPAERQLSAKKGRMEQKGCSFKKIHSGERGQSSQSRCTFEKGNTVENRCSVEKSHHSMRKGFPIEKPSSGSMPKVQLQKNMQNTPESRSGSGTSKVPQIPRQNVAGAVSTFQREQAVQMKRGIILNVPEELKPCLVEDWDLVNKQKQLFQLPAKKNVDTILAEYVTFVKSQGRADNKEYSVDELVIGVREYFNSMLGTQLLCPFEKPQYAEIHLAYPDAPMSQVYGAPHLLRLFVKIGTAMVHSSLNRPSLRLVCSYLPDLLKYLAENSSSLFSASNYRVASAEYCCKAL